jgi:hypothetical protein
MMRLLITLLLMAVSAAAAPVRHVEVILAVGAEGAEEYGRRFADQVTAWQSACEKAGVPCATIGDSADAKAGGEDLQRLKDALASAAAKGEEGGQLWLVFIGHGTFDGREAKFNLRGPDLTPRDLAEWLKPLKRELVMIHTSSASAPFLTALAGPHRILVSATKGADEVFYARFGEYFAPAIGGLPEADLDQDQQVSVLEAFLHASRKAAEFYEEDGRLATEHALLDDNGDGAGTRAEVFTGLTPRVAEGAKADGARAAQVALVLSPAEAALSEATRAKRDALETRLEQLKSGRAKLGDDAYYAELEKLLRELSALYEEPPSS